MTENTIGMWRQWMRGAAGKDYEDAINELCDLAIAGLNAAPQPPGSAMTGSVPLSSATADGAAPVAQSAAHDRKESK